MKNIEKEINSLRHDLFKFDIQFRASYQSMLSDKKVFLDIIKRVNELEKEFNTQKEL